MATISKLIENRMPDEAVLFAASLPDFVEEAQALAGFEGVDETELSVVQKSLIADIAAQALIVPALSHYKSTIAKMAGDGAGSAEFTDKLEFLQELDKRLSGAIINKKETLNSVVVDDGIPMMVVLSE